MSPISTFNALQILSRTSMRTESLFSSFLYVLSLIPASHVISFLEYPRRSRRCHKRKYEIIPAPPLENGDYHYITTGLWTGDKMTEIWWKRFARSKALFLTVWETGFEPCSLNAKPLTITAFSNLHVSFLRFSCLLYLRTTGCPLIIYFGWNTRKKTVNWWTISQSSFKKSGL